MSGSALPRGLYAITDSERIPRGNLIARVAQAIDGGAVLIQYREKFLSREERGREAQTLVMLCRERGIPLIINDDIELAAASAAAGVHLGQNDAPVGQARRRLGPQAIIGVSCYNQLERARAAASMGASYVAFGRFFPSRTKPETVRGAAGAAHAVAQGDRSAHRRHRRHHSGKRRRTHQCRRRPAGRHPRRVWPARYQGGGAGVCRTLHLSALNPADKIAVCPARDGR